MNRKQNTYNATDHLEMVFENRNKTYGAYELRQLSSRYALRGFMFGALSIFMAFFYPIARTYLKELLTSEEESQLPVVQRKIVSYSELSAPPPIELDEPPPQKVKLVKQVKSTLKFLIPVIKKDEEVPDEELIPSRDELAHTDPGFSTVKGNDSIIYDEPVEVIEVPEPEPEPKAVQVFNFSQVMPSFPGGEEEFYKFLNKNLRYPPMALDNNVEGQVIVQFVVGADGSISNAQVIRGIGSGCDEEAIRVVNMMPKWSPGRNNNKAVPVKFVIPVRFVIVL